MQFEFFPSPTLTLYLARLFITRVLGVLLIPGAFVFLAKTGPLAWNGLLADVIPSAAYFLWKIATPVVLLRAITAEEAETSLTADAERAGLHPA